MNFFDDKSTALDIPDGVVFNAWRLKILSPQVFSQLSLKEKLKYLCHFGILAPSSHNSAPERFKLNEKNNSIEVFLDKKVVLPESDPTGRQATISVGCVVENIMIASRYYSYEPDVKIKQGSNDRYMPLVEILFSKKNTVSDLTLLKTILKRKVLRAEYDPALKIGNDIKNTISNLVKQEFPASKIFLIEDKATIHQLGKYQELADRTVFEKKAFTKELGKWLLPNTDKNKVGIQGKEFGFDDKFSKHLHEGLLQKKRLLPDEVAGFASAGKLLINSSSAVGIILGKKDNSSCWLEAGRAYERVALLLMREGFFTSIHAAMIEVERIRKMLMVLLKTDYTPLMTFRIGKPISQKDSLRPHSTRPSLEEILL